MAYTGEWWIGIYLTLALAEWTFKNPFQFSNFSVSSGTFPCMHPMQPVAVYITLSL